MRLLDRWASSRAQWLIVVATARQVGEFPRSMVDPQRRKTQLDISQPLKNSFIHTGHLDASGAKWGDPAAIDECVTVSHVFAFEATRLYV